MLGLLLFLVVLCVNRVAGNVRSFDEKAMELIGKSESPAFVRFDPVCMARATQCFSPASKLQKLRSLLLREEERRGRRSGGCYSTVLTSPFNPSANPAHAPTPILLSQTIKVECDSCDLLDTFWNMVGGLPDARALSCETYTHAHTPTPHTPTPHTPTPHTPTHPHRQTDRHERDCGISGMDMSLALLCRARTLGHAARLSNVC